MGPVTKVAKRKKKQKIEKWWTTEDIKPLFSGLPRLQKMQTRIGFASKN